MTITPKPGVLDITPYKGGRGGAKAGARLHRLASNESPLGPSPKAIAAYRAAESELRCYPDSGATPLRDALALAHGVAADRIVCGNGSDEIISLIANCYLRAGDEVIFTEHAFVVYRMATLANSAKPVVVRERARRADIDAMLSAVTAQTRLVYLANPNNPTGTYIPSSELRRLHAGLPKDVLFVVDSAYAEYVRRDDYESGIDLVTASGNVVMLRTFSKIYGLAGLRVGWAYCPADVADALHRVRSSFNVNVAAQHAAVAALEDRAFTEAARQHNETWRAWLTQSIRELGLMVDDGAGNFVLIQFANAEVAGKADRFLIERGLMLRPLTDYGLPNCLRLTVGTEEANTLVLAVLAEFLR